MGMFDYINYQHNCPKCGHLITNWQSQDGSCDLAILEIYNVKDFYTYCDNCHVWIEAEVDEVNTELNQITKKVTLYIDGEVVE